MTCAPGLYLRGLKGAQALKESLHQLTGSPGTVSLISLYENGCQLQGGGRCLWLWPRTSKRYNLVDKRPENINLQDPGQSVAGRAGCHAGGQLIQRGRVMALPCRPVINAM